MTSYHDATLDNWAMSTFLRKINRGIDSGWAANIIGESEVDYLEAPLSLCLVNLAEIILFGNYPIHFFQNVLEAVYDKPHGCFACAVDPYILARHGHHIIYRGMPVRAPPTYNSIFGVISSASASKSSSSTMLRRRKVAA